MRLRAVLNGNNLRSKTTALLGVSGFLFWGGTAVFAQAAMPMSDPPSQQTLADSPVDQNQQLSDQVTELRGQVAKLQAALQQTSSGRKVSSKSCMKIAPASDKIMGMGDDGGEMGGMAPRGVPVRLKVELRFKGERKSGRRTYLERDDEDRTTELERRGKDKSAAPAFD